MALRPDLIEQRRFSRSSLFHVSHLRPEELSTRHRRSFCRKGRHHYGEPQHIGAGIIRKVCDVCSSVTIDLTGAYEAKSPIVSNNRTIISLVTRETGTD